MKANEFVKRYGWTGFKIACQYRAISRYKYTIIWSDEVGFSSEINEVDAEWTFESKDVLRLVKSHNLIASCGGLEQAKAYEIDANACGAFNDEIKLKQAIADVESCHVD